MIRSRNLRKIFLNSIPFQRNAFLNINSNLKIQKTIEFTINKNLRYISSRVNDNDPSQNESSEANETENKKTSESTSSREDEYSEGESTENDSTERDKDEIISEKEEIIAEKDEQIKEMEDQLLRYVAEVDNIRKISQNEIEKAKLFSVTKFATSLLDSYDNLQRAYSAEIKENDKEVKSLREGIKFTEDSLYKTFREFNIEKVL